MKSCLSPFVVSAEQSEVYRTIGLMNSLQRRSVALLRANGGFILLLSIVFSGQMDAAVRNFNTCMNATGITQEELDSPLKATVEIQKRSKIFNKSKR